MITQPDTPTPQADPNFAQPKSLIDLEFVPIIGNVEAPYDVQDIERDLVLTHAEARAGSPEDVAACGEEDPGSGLEFLVTRDDEYE